MIILHPARLLACSCGLPLALGLAASPAHAEWDVTVSPYVWASGLDGQASVTSSLPPADVHDDFGDVLDKLDIAFFGAVEARGDGIVLRGDIMYASLTAKATVPVALYESAALTSETFNLAGFGGYTLVDQDGARVDVLAGARYWDVSNTIKFAAGTRPALTANAGKSFLDPLVGVSAEVPISGSVKAVGTGTIGGFGIGADLEYGLTGALLVGLGEKWGLTAGYRLLSVEYDDDDGFIYDINQHGPFVGAYLSF